MPRAALKLFLIAAMTAAVPALALEHATEGVITHVDSAAKKIAVKTADGTEEVFKFTGKTAMHAAKGVKTGAVDTYLAGKEGTHVVVHYTEEGAEKTAVAVDDFGKDTVKVGKGTVTDVRQGWPHRDHKDRGWLRGDLPRRQGCRCRYRTWSREGHRVHGQKGREGHRTLHGRRRAEGSALHQTPVTKRRLACATLLIWDSQPGCERQPSPPWRRTCRKAACRRWVLQSSNRVSAKSGTPCR